MKPVFLDTVGLIAVLDKADQWHGPAEAAFAAIMQSRRRVATTTFVFAETANAAARKPYRSHVNLLRETFEARGDVIAPGREDWDAAWLAYEKGEAANAGLIDHLSFAVMRRLGVTEAFTNDRHFHAAGFVTLF